MIQWSKFSRCCDWCGNKKYHKNLS